MGDYYIRWSEGSPGRVREIPLGIYAGPSAEAAIGRAGREWSLDIDSLIADPLPQAARVSVQQGPVPSLLGSLSV
jgi:hypothetical protein